MIKLSDNDTLPIKKTVSGADGGSDDLVDRAAAGSSTNVPVDRMAAKAVARWENEGGSRILDRSTKRD